MRKHRIVGIMMLVLLVCGAVSVYAADNVLGLWKIIDDKTDKPTAFVVLYLYNGKMYGRIVATISKETGVVDDTLDIKGKRFTALAGDPLTCGLDFVFDMEERSKDWKGSIIDPEDGKSYDCTIKRDGNKLIVRGSLKGTGGLLGRNQTWLQASPSDIPSFTIPPSSGFVPVIPKKK